MFHHKYQHHFQSTHLACKRGSLAALPVQFKKQSTCWWTKKESTAFLFCVYAEYISGLMIAFTPSKQTRWSADIYPKTIYPKCMHHIGLLTALPMQHQKTMNKYVNSLSLSTIHKQTLIPLAYPKQTSWPVPFIQKPSTQMYASNLSI